MHRHQLTPDICVSLYRFMPLIQCHLPSEVSPNTSSVFYDLAYIDCFLFSCLCLPCSLYICPLHIYMLRTLVWVVGNASSDRSDLSQIFEYSLYIDKHHMRSRMFAMYRLFWRLIWMGTISNTSLVIYVLLTTDYVSIYISIRLFDLSHLPWV